MKIGYARVSTAQQDLTAQLEQLERTAVVKAKGRLRGKKPKLSPTQEKHLVELWRAVEHTSAELASEFGVARSTVCRAEASTRTKEGASA